MGTGNAVEKTFWVIVVILGWTCALYMVTSQLIEWQSNPTGMHFKELLDTP